MQNRTKCFDDIKYAIANLGQLYQTKYIMLMYDFYKFVTV